MSHPLYICKYIICFTRKPPMCTEKLTRLEIPTVTISTNVKPLHLSSREGSQCDSFLSPRLLACGKRLWVRALVSKQFGPFDSRWRPLHLACVPDSSEVAPMLRELEVVYGRRSLGSVLGVCGMTARAWLDHGANSLPARRVVWLTWTMLLHPDKLRSGWDWVTWGRFADNKAVRKRVAKLSRELKTTRGL